MATAYSTEMYGKNILIKLSLELKIFFPVYN